jgi:hypothetical protein
MRLKVISGLIAILLIFSDSVLAQEKADLYDIPIDRFERLYIEGAYRVFLYQSAVPYLRVKAASESHAENLGVSFDSHKLRLSVSGKHLSLYRMELHIGFDHLREVHINGSVKITTDGFVEVGDLNIIAEGAVNGDLRLKANSVGLTSSGGSVFFLAGVTDMLSARVTGAGHVNTRELTAREVVFRVEGLGFGSVHASEKLDVRIDGVGKVTYTGSPDVLKVVEGLGSVARYQ